MSRPPSTEALQRALTRLVSYLFGGQATVRVALEREPNGAQVIRCSWLNANGWDGVVTLGRSGPPRMLTAKEVGAVLSFVDDQTDPPPTELGEAWKR